MLNLVKPESMDKIHNDFNAMFLLNSWYLSRFFYFYHITLECPIRFSENHFFFHTTIPEVREFFLKKSLASIAVQTQGSSVLLRCQRKTSSVPQRLPSGLTAMPASRHTHAHYSNKTGTKRNRKSNTLKFA